MKARILGVVLAALMTGLAAAPVVAAADDDGDPSQCVQVTSSTIEMKLPKATQLVYTTNARGAIVFAAYVPSGVDLWTHVQGIISCTTNPAMILQQLIDCITGATGPSDCF